MYIKSKHVFMICVVVLYIFLVPFSVRLVPCSFKVRIALLKFRLNSYSVINNLNDTYYTIHDFEYYYTTKLCTSRDCTDA